MRFLIFCIAILAFVVSPACGAESGKLRILLLGDNGHHKPAERFKQLQPVLAERGVELTYTDKMGDINAENLAKYNGLAIYANTTHIEPEQEKALLEYVEGGKGLIAIHCASYCFLNSPKYVTLVGAQFKRHGTGTFRTEIADEDKPIVRGFGGFESWDETYVHAHHNDNDRTVLEYRDEKGEREPWTWTRTQGKGRVFYTAWGHDQRTWGNAGFQNLIERGMRWAVSADVSVVPAFADQTTADKPRMTAKRTDVKPFEYQPAHVPFYPPSGARRGDGEWSKMQKPLAAEES